MSVGAPTRSPFYLSLSHSNLKHEHEHELSFLLILSPWFRLISIWGLLRFSPRYSFTTSESVGVWDLYFGIGTIKFLPKR
jgi:hypothetical protein